MHVRSVCSYKVVPLEGYVVTKICCWSNAMNCSLNEIIKIQQYSLLARWEQQKQGTERQSGQAVLQMFKPAGRITNPSVSVPLMSAVTVIINGEVNYLLGAADNCSNRLPIRWFSDSNWEMMMSLLDESSYIHTHNGTSMIQSWRSQTKNRTYLSYNFIHNVLPWWIKSYRFWQITLLTTMVCHGLK